MHGSHPSLLTVILPSYRSLSLCRRAPEVGVEVFSSGSCVTALSVTPLLPLFVTLIPLVNVLMLLSHSSRVPFCIRCERLCIYFPERVAYKCIVRRTANSRRALFFQTHRPAVLLKVCFLVHARILLHTITQRAPYCFASHFLPIDSFHHRLLRLRPIR